VLPAPLTPLLCGCRTGKSASRSGPSAQFGTDSTAPATSTVGCLDVNYCQLRQSLRRACGSRCAIVLPEGRAYTPKVPRQIEQVVELCHAREAWERAVLPAFPTHIALAIGGG